MLFEWGLMKFIQQMQIAADTEYPTKRANMST